MARTQNVYLTSVDGAARVIEESYMEVGTLGGGQRHGCWKV